MAPPVATATINGSQGAPYVTLAEGRPVTDPAAALQIRSSFGGGGLGLLQDTQLIEVLAHFPRERIPERTVHAHAAGAWGEYEVTHDISDITDAKFLTGIGKKTPFVTRISTVGPEKGGADTVRDVRGWATKFFTEEGNQDFVFNDQPVFFVRDPIKFPSLNRSHKKHPRLNISDPNLFWDFHNNNQEGIHAIMHLLGPRGIPASLRHINGYSNHTYKLGKADGSFKYVKFHLKADGGVKSMPADQAEKLAGSDPDYLARDLYEAIDRGEYPSWTVHIQVMEPKDAETYRWNIFDITKVWPHSDYPLIPIGKYTINKNAENYFEEIEQAAFSPSTMVPGIGPSADLMLQARMFSYPDAARYRLGPNYTQLPTNRPLSKVYTPYIRDGPATINGNFGGDPNYIRSQIKPVAKPKTAGDIAHDQWVGQVTEYTTEVTDDDFVQAKMLWDLMGKNGEQEILIDNAAGMLKPCRPDLQKGAIEMFSKVDAKLGKAITEKIISP